jgi:Resolvase, N terminal domain/Helix-turn-helix domain of resolvase
MEVTVQGWESGDGHSLKRESARVRSGDTSTAAGKCFLDMLGVFAEFETNLRRERQLEGIAKAKGPVLIDTTKVREMKAQGMGASEIAKALRIGRASVYRALSLRNLRANPPRRFDRLPKERTAADIEAELDAAIDVAMREG